MQPQLPIDVDPKTGVWTTDALPMLYVPRHFFTNNHMAVEEALGRDAYAEILYKAGYKSAYHWCDKEAKQHGISRHGGVRALPEAPVATRLGHVHDRGSRSGDVARAHRTASTRRSCWRSRARGQALLHVRGLVRGRDGLGQRHRAAPSAKKGPRSHSVETQCAAEGHDHCVFEVSPLAS